VSVFTGQAGVTDDDGVDCVTRAPSGTGWVSCSTPASRRPSLEPPTLAADRFEAVALTEQQARLRQFSIADHEARVRPVGVGDKDGDLVRVRNRPIGVQFDKHSCKQVLGANGVVAADLLNDASRPRTDPAGPRKMTPISHARSHAQRNQSVAPDG
jgi:hypothetical protein